MALVMHTSKGKKYIYDHHRKGNDTKSTYIAPVKRIKKLEKIVDKSNLTKNPDYLRAHRIANEAEKKEYGQKRFDELNRVLRRELPDNELAGVHMEKGILIRSDKVPKKFEGQVLFHERIENEEMIKAKKRQKALNYGH